MLQPSLTGCWKTCIEQAVAVAVAVVVVVAVVVAVAVVVVEARIHSKKFELDLAGGNLNLKCSD